MFRRLLVLCMQEEMNRGKPNWEHLNEDLHVLITVEDTRSRAELKLRRAVDEVKKLLVPAVSLLSLSSSAILILLCMLDTHFLLRLCHCSVKKYIGIGNSNIICIVCKSY